MALGSPRSPQSCPGSCLRGGGCSPGFPQSTLGCSSLGPSVSEQTGVPPPGWRCGPVSPRGPSDPGLRGRAGLASLGAEWLKGCQDLSPTDIAGTWLRRNRSMPGFPRDFEGNGHFRKGKTDSGLKTRVEWKVPAHTPSTGSVGVCVSGQPWPWCSAGLLRPRE